MALMGEMTNHNRILIAKPEEKQSFWRLKSRWIDSVIKMDRITQILYVCGDLAFVAKNGNQWRYLLKTAVKLLSFVPSLTSSTYSL